MQWFRADISLTSETDPDSLISQLRQLGAAGFEIRDESNHIIAYFEKSGTYTSSQLETEINSLPERDTKQITRLDIEPHQQRDWSEEYKTYFETTKLSPRSLVSPPWDLADNPDEPIQLVINPGLAFGTGTHETTQMCATYLDNLLLEMDSPSVLDVGCGSGILSMLAVKLGACDVVGIDTDATAIDIARENARQNGVEGQIEFTDERLASITRNFDIVVANILSSILLELRDDLVEHLTERGDLILSGIDTASEDKLLSFFSNVSLQRMDRRQRSKWIALHFQTSS